MQRIRDRALHRFVVFRKWSISKRREWTKDTTDTLGIHDEWSHVIRRLRIDFEIGNVVADPSLLRVVPPDLPALVAPRLACRIAGSAVVHDAPVSGPRETPVRINAETRRIVRAASLHLRTGFGPRTGVEPVAAGACTV